MASPPPTKISKNVSNHCLKVKSLIHTGKKLTSIAIIYHWLKTSVTVHEKTRLMMQLISLCFLFLFQEQEQELQLQLQEQEQEQGKRRRKRRILFTFEISKSSTWTVWHPLGAYFEYDLLQCKTLSGFQHSLKKNQYKTGIWGYCKAGNENSRRQKC